MDSNWHLAQMNVGTVLFPPEDPRLSGFMNRLDEINALAEQSPGFVWRLQSESGNATDIDVGGPELFLVNMSVWQSAEHLFDYVYKSMHRDIMVQRRQWFEKPIEQYQVLWWVPVGHLPTAEEGLARLEYLKEQGASEHAFTFKQRFEGPGSSKLPDSLTPESYCAGWD